LNGLFIVKSLTRLFFLKSAKALIFSLIEQ